MYEERFEWVNPEQRSRLESIYGGEWGEPLDVQLTDTYGEDWYTDNEEPQLVELLDQLLAQIGNAVPNVSDLAWLTDVQVGQLEQLAASRGDFHEWFPIELDNAWPEWRQSTPDVIGPWLDGLIPSLVLSSEEGGESEEPDPLDELSDEEFESLQLVLE